MNKDVVPVAELNFPSVRPGKFSWDLSPSEVANSSRKHRSDPPEYHIQLRIKNDNTIPLTSTPKGVNPVNVPLPDSAEISWDSENSLKPNSKPKVIIKQPNSSISPVSVDKISDKSPSYSNTALAKNVVLDLHALSSVVNDNINISAATEPDVIVAAVVQNLPAILLVIQGPVVEGEDPGVGIDPVDLQLAPVVPGPVDIQLAPVAPDPVDAQPVPIVLGLADIQPAPVAQGPINAPFVIPLILDGDNNNDSSEDESIAMTDNVIAPPTFNGKAGQDPSDWLRHFILYSTFKGYTDDRQKSLFKVLLTDGAADWLEGHGFPAETTFNDLKQAFEQRFKSPNVLKYKNAKEVFTRRQGVSQSVDDYVTDMLKIGKAIEISDQMLKFAVLNGLRPELATYVTQRQPENMADLLQAARIAELTLPASKDTELHDKVDRLMAHWDKLSTAQVTERRSPSPAPGTSFPMPSKRVTFEDSRYSFLNGRPRFAVLRQVNPNLPRMSGPFGPNRSMQGVRSDAWRRFDTTPPGFAGNPPLQRFPTPSSQAQRCAKCGRGLHPHPNYCPAINESCFIQTTDIIASCSPYKEAKPCKQTPRRILNKQSDAQLEIFVEDYGFTINKDLTNEQRRDLLQLLYDYKGSSARSLAEIKVYQGYEHDIELVSNQRIFKRNYRLTSEDVAIAEKQI